MKSDAESGAPPEAAGLAPLDRHHPAGDRSGLADRRPPLPQHTARAWAINRKPEMFTVRWGRVLTPYPAKLHITDFALEQKTTRMGVTITADRIDTRLGLLPFLTKTLRATGVENYFLSGRKTSWWLLGTSMADTPLAVFLIAGRGPDPSADTSLKVFTWNGSTVVQRFSLEAYPGLTHGLNVAGGWF